VAEKAKKKMILRGREMRKREKRKKVGKKNREKERN